MPSILPAQFTRVLQRLSWNDAKAGLTTALLLIPQSMAYAILAGLPPEMGLYAATVPILIYAVFGTSKQLAVGPVAMVSLLTLDSLKGSPGLDPHNSSSLIELAILLMSMVGVIQILMGLLRLGFLTRLLAPPIILGYTFAAAILISSSQLKSLLGLSFPRGSFLKTAQSVFENVGEIHLTTALLGLGAFIVLRLIQSWNRMFPRHIAVIILGSLLVFILDLDEQGVRIIGTIPQGFPSPALPVFSWPTVEGLLPGALVIAVVGFLESYSVAETVARLKNEHIEPSRELFALGAANVIGSFFHGYPISGGLSRTLVNTNAGAESQQAGVVTAAVVLFATIAIGPLCQYIPLSVLAVLIISAVLGFIDMKALREKCPNRYSRISFFGTFSMTLFAGVVEGIAFGIALELVSKFVSFVRHRMKRSKLKS
ncbi:MAG: SulP family inorganic anion transporter [Planctomycetota bacterium]|nr:SulP family inorganic anion transporter [Planctomycetota bacterium]